MKELGIFENRIKRKRRQLITDGYFSIKVASEGNRLTDKQKSNSILDLMMKNAFLSADKIIKKPIMSFKHFYISETTVQRFLNEEGFSLKEPITRVKMSCLKKLWLTFWNKNIDWSNFVFTDELSFIFITQGKADEFHKEK